MSRREVVEINWEKLKKKFDKRGLKGADAARELGFQPNYFSNVKARGHMSKSTALLLDKVYGIKIDDIIDKQDEDVPEQVKQEFDYNKLYEVIYTAVYKAMQMAWKEC